MGDYISEKTKIYLPVGLAVTVCIAMFYGGWNLNAVNNSINTRFEKIENQLNDLENSLKVTKRDQITHLHLRLFCSELERLNPDIDCPDIENIHTNGPATTRTR